MPQHAAAAHELGEVTVTNGKIEAEGVGETILHLEKSFEWTGRHVGTVHCGIDFSDTETPSLCPKYVSERAGERPFRERVSEHART